MEITGEMPIKKFINNLESLSGRERTILRHNAESSIVPTGGDALTIFYKVLPYKIAPDEEELWFVAAMIRFYSRCSIPGIHEANNNDFGWTLRKIRNGDSFDQRVRALLDCRYQKGDRVLADRLRHMVKLAEIKQVGINWPVFTMDLLHWEDPERSTQKKWARSYYGGQTGVF